MVEREGGEFEDVKRQIREREKSEKKRYMDFYGIDMGDLSIYDVVIDTTSIPPQTVIEKIIEEMDSKRNV